MEGRCSRLLPALLLLEHPDLFTGSDNFFLKAGTDSLIHSLFPPLLDIKYLAAVGWA